MLRNSQLIDTFHFSDLSELRDFLNQFKSTDLTVVHPEGADHLVLDWFEETLSDGSTVNNVRITNREA